SHECTNNRWMLVGSSPGTYVLSLQCWASIRHSSSAGARGAVNSGEQSIVAARIEIIKHNQIGII
ncbi:hypothetical protein U1Q18_018424, partial [Sarracenia purpurea var. burkii]